MLLPLNDLQGEIRGLSGKNVFNTQLQTGAVEKPSIAGSAIETGVLSFTLEEGNIDDDKTTVVTKQNCKSVKCRKPKRHQGTQTEAFTLPMAALNACESLRDTQETYVSTNNTNKNLDYMYLKLEVNKFARCPYVIRTRALSVIRTYQVSFDIHRSSSFVRNLTICYYYYDL